MKKVSIIGAGFSGMTAGIYLLEHGYDVTIYEKNPVAGGFVAVWKRKNTWIDGCMHWMFGTNPAYKLNHVLNHIGALDNNHIIHPNAFCKVEYENETFSWYRGIDRLEKEMRRVGLEDDEEITIFIDAVKAFIGKNVPIDVPFELADKDSFKMDMNLMRKVRPYLKLSLGELAERFHSPILKYAFHNFLINDHFSAYYFIETMANFVDSNASLPSGCSISIRDGMLQRFLSLGGKIVYNSNVQRIIVEGTIAKGIELMGGEFIPSDYIIPACDMHYTMDVLLKDIMDKAPLDAYDLEKEKYVTYSYCIATYRTKYNFENHEIAELTKVNPYMVLGKMQDCLSVRQYAYDEKLVNEEGYSSVQVYLTTYEEDYEKIKAMTKEEYKAFKKELGALYLGMLKEKYHQEFELIDVLTPLTYERYMHSYKGVFMPYALGPKIPQPTRSLLLDNVSNIVLTGQWLMLPGGTPMAAMVGKFAAQHILYKDGLDYHI